MFEFWKMAPSPENDSAPKAPDKTNDKNRSDGQENVHKECSSAVDGDSKDASVSTLDDKALKALLDEAITYKSPRDRQGKSLLFNNLLTEAEDDLRNARATSAGGPQLVRHYNQSASKRHRNRRQASSISENLTHGGSLNNLAKEELYEAAIQLQRPKKTVSARQREGGSLPCNVNAAASYDLQFFEEARKKEKEKSKVIYCMDMEPDRNFDHDILASNEIEEEYTRLPAKYSKNTKIHEPYINTSNCTVPTLEKAPKIIDGDHPKSVSYEPFAKLNGTFPVFSCKRDDKKVVDENCNALGTGLNQKKKIKKKLMEKNVNVLQSTDISGHRSDIIDDVDKLIDFIDGNDSFYGGQKSKSGVQKSQKIHKNIFDESKANRKQRTRSKGKGCNNLHKSNSLEEISTTKLEDFEFLQEDGKVSLRSTKSNTDKPRERRSWGNSEQIQIQSLYNVSIENLETADFRVVTKKKKSKKRRSSLSSRRQGFSREEHVGEFNRVPSPEPRRKSAISVPHSEKSNDSSDVDSVHSLPIDANRMNLACDYEDNVNFPISYADIAKNTNQLDKFKWNRTNGDKKKGGEKKSSEKNVPTSPDSDCSRTEVCALEKLSKKKMPEEKGKAAKQPTVSACPQQAKTMEKSTVVQEDRATKNNQPAELTLVNYMANFPSIKEKSPTGDQQQKPVKNIVAEIQNWPAIPANNNNVNNKTYDKGNLNKTNANQQKTQRNLTNHFKNVKNVQAHRHDKQQINIGTNNVKAQNILYSNETQVMQNLDRPMNAIYTHQNMPLNIQDVRTIEKHFKNPANKPIFFHNQFFCQLQRYPSDDGGGTPQIQQLPLPAKEVALPATNYPDEETVNSSAQCDEYATTNNIDDGDDKANDDCDRTTNDRPAVVILSGNGEKEVSGITFGFDINEQLLSDDVCADFLARFVPPDDCDLTNGFNLDKIVNFIGIAWEDVIRETNGSVKYYTEEL